jgi:ribosomal-protein-alanine N-acetyltransferase
MYSEHSIRPMRVEDWEALHKMEQETFKDDSVSRDQFMRSISTRYFAALESDGQLVGQLTLSRFGEDEGVLNRIGVAKSFQRRGLGSYLLKHAIEWLEKQGDISVVHLYTQDYNIPAQSLYKKFGFEISGTTWHYFVPFATINPNERYSCQQIRDDEIDYVGEQYPTLPATQIRNYLEDEVTKYYILTLKDMEGKIKGTARFTPSFPGSFPFEISGREGFDDFMKGIEKLSLPEFDYVRTVFTDNPELAGLCDERNYHLHHRLYRMSLNLK